jgi:hypothetical protein
MAAAVDDGTERQKLASYLTIVAVAGMTAISIVVIVTSDAKDRDSASRFVMTAVLPLLGSWVATVLAYYFARENLRAATNSVSTLLADNRQQLAVISVRNKMIERTRIVSLSDAFKDLPAAKLSDVVKFLTERSVSRSPLFDPSGAVTHVVHMSSIDKFARGKALEALTFADLLKDDTIGPLLSHSLDVVSERASLAEAKAKMNATPDCEDIFVTKTGRMTECVTGWITDNVII